jgi:YfiR/HmsC-like
MRISLFAKMTAALALGLCLISPAHAAADISLADLKAAIRSLGFLQNLPHSDAFVIGVVYAPGSLDNKSLAQQTAERIRTIPGPTDAGLRAEVISATDLAQYPGHVDALFLVPGNTTAAAVGIADTARRKHLLVMSNDPSCFDQRCCMLMVRSGTRVDIVLDTALAASAGVNFSSVFAMMVKHR